MKTNIRVSEQEGKVRIEMVKPRKLKRGEKPKTAIFTAKGTYTTDNTEPLVSISFPVKYLYGPERNLGVVSKALEIFIKESKQKKLI